jgi:hypothetical protein
MSYSLTVPAQPFQLVADYSDAQGVMHAYLDTCRELWGNLRIFSITHEYLCLMNSITNLKSSHLLGSSPSTVLAQCLARNLADSPFFIEHCFVAFELSNVSLAPWFTKYTGDPYYPPDTCALYFLVQYMTFTVAPSTSYTCVYICTSHVYE